jgi:hypothetical protein
MYKVQYYSDISHSAILLVVCEGWHFIHVEQNEDNNASSLAIHEEKISTNIQNEEVTYISTCVLIYSMSHCITYCVLHNNKCIVYIMITSEEIGRASNI